MLKATALHLLIPSTVANPDRLAKDIIAAWPAKRLITKFKVKVLAVEDGVETQECN